MRPQNPQRVVKGKGKARAIVENCALKRPPHLTLQRPDAYVLLVELLLLESDPLQQIIDASVLVLQHHLMTRHIFFFISFIPHSSVRKTCPWHLNAARGRYLG